MARLITGIVLLGVGCTQCALFAADKPDAPQQAVTPLELFDQRILPIFRSPKPSSCVQCHLAAVDLKNYILPSHEKTFVSLRDQGLINLDDPGRSKILELIRMGDKDLDTGARLIHEKMRRAEYEAFAGWIEASSNDPRLRNLPPLDPQQRAQPARPLDVIRHARKSRVVDSFVRNIWSQRLRCFPCHTPHDIDPDNPRHAAAVKKQKEFEAQYPELVDRLNIFRESPEATLRYLIERSRDVKPGELPMLNLEDPERSLLVQKPLSKLPQKRDDGKFAPPSSRDPVSHMGGLKMHPNDQSYKSFIAWIDDYRKVVGNEYQAVEELPQDNWFATRRVLRMTEAPADWATATPVQLFVHAWDDAANDWNPQPIGFTQGSVTPRKIVNGTLFLIASGQKSDISDWDRENASLERGRYLVKVYVDSRNQLQRDPTLFLGQDDFVGQAELKRARWREGFRQAESISGAGLTK